MPLKAYRSSENQRQRKRRRCISQLSLSSLHSAENIHSENQLSGSGVENVDNPQGDEAVPEGEKNHGNFHNATTQSDSVEYLAPEEICSVGYFRATPVDEFRQRCRKCVKQSVQSSSKISLMNESKGGDNTFPFGLIRYNRWEVVRLFTNDIDWKSLCEHHDKRQYKRENHAQDDKSSKTALCEIVLAMTDPTATPSCCQSKCIIDIIFNALLMSPSMSASQQKRRKLHHQKYSSTMASNAMLRWTPSQQFLLRTIQRLLLSQGMSLDICVSDYVRNFVLFRPPFLSAVERGSNKTNASVLSPNKVNRLLSAIYWFLSSSILPLSVSIQLETDLISSGLLLLERIDGWSIQIDIKSQKQHGAGKSTGCIFCNPNCSDHQTTDGKGTRRNINRKMTIEAISNLHDEAMDVESNFAQTSYNNNKMPWRRSFSNTPKKVSLKDVLTMKQREGTVSVTKCTCDRNCKSGREKQAAVRPSSIAALSSDWSTVCSRGYKKFLSYSTERRQQQHTTELSSNHYNSSRTIAKRNSDEGFLEWLVNDAVLHYGSPSRRVCIALVAHIFGGPNNPFYFKYVAHLFWEGYLSSSRQQNESSTQWLRLYSEWVSDCAVFDQPEIAWGAFQPILEHITAVLLSNEQDQVDTNDKSNIPTTRIYDKQETNSDLNGPLMACVGYILHRRSHLFRIHRCSNGEDDSMSKSTIEKDFGSFINLLSIYCGEDSELWLGLFSDSIRDLIESTLQRLGVLSISVPDAEGQMNNKNNRIRSKSLDTSISDVSMKFAATSNWPFCEDFGLRRAMGRVDRGVLSLENGIHPEKLLLSNPSADSFNINERTKAGVRSSKKPGPSVPMNNYLHDGGILSLIFSFCAPKRLAKIPLVCKTWKAVSDTVSNSLWEKAYLSSFGKYCWPCLEAERRYCVSMCATTIIDSKSSSKETENVGTDYWKNLFTQKQIAEKMIRFKRNSRSGYKYRTCNYLGCLHILKTSEQEQKHNQMHLRQLTKQQAALQKKQKLKKKKDMDGSKSRGRKKKSNTANHDKPIAEKKKAST